MSIIVISNSTYMYKASTSPFHNCIYQSEIQFISYLRNYCKHVYLPRVSGDAIEEVHVNKHDPDVDSCDGVDVLYTCI